MLDEAGRYHVLFCLGRMSVFWRLSVQFGASRNYMEISKEPVGLFLSLGSRRYIQDTSALTLGPAFF